jgi:hypothetical protein
VNAASSRGHERRWRLGCVHRSEGTKYKTKMMEEQVPTATSLPRGGVRARNLPGGEGSQSSRGRRRPLGSPGNFWRKRKKCQNYGPPPVWGKMSSPREPTPRHFVPQPAYPFIPEGGSFLVKKGGFLEKKRCMGNGLSVCGDVQPPVPRRFGEISHHSSPLNPRKSSFSGFFTFFGVRGKKRHPPLFWTF